MRRSKQQRGMAWLLTFVMIFSMVVSTPGNSLNVQAASRKYVKSLSVKKNISVAVGSKVTVKPTVKVVKKASTKVTVKVKNKKIAKASYSSKSKKISIQGKKTGKTKITVTTVGKNKKGKKISKTINVKVTKKKSTASTKKATTTEKRTTTEKVKTEQETANIQATTEKVKTEQSTPETVTPGDNQSGIEDAGSEATTEATEAVTEATTETATEATTEATTETTEAVTETTTEAATETTEAVTEVTTEATTETTEATTEATTETATVLVKSITLSRNNISMLKGEKTVLSADIIPDDAASKKVTWKVSPADVVSINDNDLEADIRAVGAGTATITVTAADGSGVTASCTVEVSDTMTVTTQEELTSALDSIINGKVILNATEGEEYTISAIHNSDLELIINGDGATVINQGEFKSVTLNGGSYVEKAASNQIYVVSSSDITVSENASATIDINISKDSGESETSGVNIINNGILDHLNIASGGTVTVSGSATDIITTTISGKDVKLITNQNMNLHMTEKAELVFQTAGVEDEVGGSTETTISVDTPEHVPDIYGVGQYIVFNDDGTSEVVMADASEDIPPVDDLYGTVVDAFEGGGVGDVSVYLIPAKQYTSEMSVQDGLITATTDNGITSVSTNESGAYTFGETASGNYYLVMSKEGYKKATQFIAVTSYYKTSFDVAKMELLKTEEAESIKGSVSGKIIDGATGKGISGLSVELRKYKGINVGDTIMTVTTGEDGSYNFAAEDGLEADQYTIRVVDNRVNAENKYITRSANVCVKSENIVKDITTSTVLGGDEIRFVLRWGDETSGAPSDLDSYLYGPRIRNLGMFQVYYGANQYGAAGKKYVELDIDDRSYGGPETTTIVEPTDGTYYYYVFNCSGDAPLNTSEAIVEVYAGNELLTTYNIPADSDATGDWWKVCSYNSRTKKLTEYNTLQEDEPSFDYDLYQGCEKLLTDVKSSEASYLNDEDTKISAPYEEEEGKVSLYGNASWGMVETTLQYQTISGYTAEFSESENTDEEEDYRGIVVLKDAEGNVIESYKLYYTQIIKLTINYSNLGITVIYIDNEKSHIDIYAPDGSDIVVDELPFICSDRNYASFEYDSDNGKLCVSDGTSAKYYTVNCYYGYYLMDVDNTAGSITDWQESDNNLEIHVNTYDNNFQVECVDGYTAEIVEGEEDLILRIADSEGTVKEKPVSVILNTSDK
jgi:uncharacterized protein YjdB